MRSCVVLPYGAVMRTGSAVAGPAMFEGLIARGFDPPTRSDPVNFHRKSAVVSRESTLCGCSRPIDNDSLRN